MLNSTSGVWFRRPLEEAFVIEVESGVLEHLRYIHGAVDSIREDICEIKGRLGILESQYAHMSQRIDRLDNRVERIEHRLQLTKV